MNEDHSVEPPVIRTENLTKTYKMGTTQVAALRGVDLTVWDGEFVALMGASGSGKSTLLHLLGCLDTPTEGRYYLKGQDISTLPVSQRAVLRNQRIGFIFQSFNLLPRFAALENVALPLQYRRWNGRSRLRAMTALEQVGLGERATHLPGELSGGECQRVAIARALVTDPAIVLADEPTGNLDSVTGAEIMRLLVSLCEQGRTIFMVTHDQHNASYAQRILRMRDGQIMPCGDDQGEHSDPTPQRREDEAD